MKKLLLNLIVLMGFALLFSSTKCKPMKTPDGYRFSVQNNSPEDMNWIHYGRLHIGNDELFWTFVEFNEFKSNYHVTATYDDLHHFEFMTPEKKIVADTVLYLPRDDVKDKSIRVTFILDSDCKLSIEKTPIPVE